MTDTKSYAEFILGTLKAQLKDCALRYPELTKEFNRDFERLSSAIECHGIRFALDDMPAWRKHFDQCLAKRRLTPSHIHHFGVMVKGGTIPRLFRGLVLRVFDRTGALRHDVDVDAIRWIRQLLGVVRKLRLASNKRDTGEVVREFINVDRTIRRATRNWADHDEFADQVENCDVHYCDIIRDQPDPNQLIFPGLGGATTQNYLLLNKVQQVADYLTSKLGVFDPTEWRPKHGPGAVAESRFGAYKYAFKSWPARLESVFPLADFAYANYALANPLVERRCSGVSFDESPARLCAVPKTLSKPRLIAAEPTSLQWCQQIVRDYFYSRVRGSLISNFIDFGRQDLNGDLALQASHDQSHSTIDLSSASDRIACWHVERLFRRSPSLLRALQVSRSAWVRQTICRVSPEYHYLEKYSTMGNATTFPVQSVFFLSLALGAVLYKRDLPVGDRIIRKMGRGTVRVFGDDIIIPDDCSGVLVELLESLGLKVNVHKTFQEGNFRESCGVDAFNGHDVTTVSVLELPKRSGPGSIVSSVDVHNNLCDKGYMHTAEFIRKTATRLGFTKIRAVKHGSGLFGWSSLYGYENTSLKVRHNRALHSRETQCLKLTVSETRRPAEESAGLLQYFIEAPRIVDSAISTLGYLIRRPKVGLRLGWVASE